MGNFFHIIMAGTIIEFGGLINFFPKYLSTYTNMECTFRHPIWDRLLKLWAQQKLWQWIVQRSYTYKALQDKFIQPEIFRLLKTSYHSDAVWSAIIHLNNYNHVLCLTVMTTGTHKTIIILNIMLCFRNIQISLLYFDFYLYHLVSALELSYPVYQFKNEQNNTLII